MPTPKILSLIRGRGPSELSDLVANAEARLAASRATEADARQGHADSLLDDEDSSASAAALVMAQRATEDATLALSAARARQDAATLAARSSDVADQWKKVEKLGGERARAAFDLETHADGFVAALAKVQRLGVEMYEASPVKDDILSASLVGPSLADRLAREHLAHRGKLPWAANGSWSQFGEQWGVTPGVAVRVIDGHAGLLQHRQEQ